MSAVYVRPAGPLKTVRTQGCIAMADNRPPPFPRRREKIKFTEEKLIRPFLVHKLLGSATPPPLSSNAFLCGPGVCSVCILPEGGVSRNFFATPQWVALGDSGSAPKGLVKAFFLYLQCYMRICCLLLQFLFRGTITFCECGERVMDTANARREHCNSAEHKSHLSSCKQTGSCGVFITKRAAYPVPKEICCC